MSISQKYPGLVLTPWFNVAEWTSVYNLIYTTPDWPEALDILKTWKLRTPLLSAGVEGTLIVLEALTLKTDNLTNFQVTHIYSTSLMRFLNLCATNSEKQGSFYKVALKNELPRWLISMRHNIAHDHKIPSKTMLETSLSFCLEWIKRKYWAIQSENMKDFTVEQTIEENKAVASRKVQDLVYVYINLNTFFYHQNPFSKLSNSLKRIIDRQLKGNNNKGNQEIMEIFWGKILDHKDQLKYVEVLICELLVDKLCILSVDCTTDDNGDKIIPLEFVEIWTNWLKLMYEAKILPNLIERLFKFVCNCNNSDNDREIASLWIRRIFQDLQLKNEQHNCEEFLKEVLENPTNFTSHFIREVLTYTHAPPEFTEDVIKLLTAFSVVEKIDDSILTVDDLPLPVNGFKRKTTKWKRVADSAVYENCPLGVLPNQTRTQNPLLYF